MKVREHLSKKNSRTHTHTHTYTHSQTHAHIHTHKHTHAHNEKPYNKEICTVNSSPDLIGLKKFRMYQVGQVKRMAKRYINNMPSNIHLLCVFFVVFLQRQIVNLTPGKYPKEHIQYSKHGESFKSRIYIKRNIVARSCNICCSGTTLSIR
jgi:hypothetical protein